MLHSTEAMCDNQNSFGSMQGSDCFHNALFGRRIKRTRCFIKHQYTGVVIERAGNADALTLTTRKANTAFAYNGFKTSDSLKAIGGNWTYQKLDDYLENPKRLAPKGIMSFAGLKKPAERAAVIKLLVANSTNPPPLEAAAAPAAEAPAPAAAPAAPPAQ